MKAILATFVTTIFLKHVSAISYWLTIGSGGIESMTIAGPNEEYSVQGQANSYLTWPINWASGAAVYHYQNYLGTNSYLHHDGRIQGDDSYNAVVSATGVFRFNIKPGVAVGLQRYSLPVGFFYNYPHWAAGTVYMFVGTVSATGTNRKLYRLHSDRITDVKTFNIGVNSRAYGVLFGTGWLVISYGGTNQRKLYDYTNGYQGGSNSSVQTHTKVAVNDELGFASLEDGRGYYVVGTLTTRVLYTIKGADGTQKLNHVLSSL